MPEHRLRDWKPALAHFKFRHEVDIERQRAFEGCHTILLRLVLIGWLESRCYDLTSIALELRMSRATATRRVNQAVAHGWITIERNGRRRDLLPAQKLLDHVAARIPTQVDRFYSRAAELRAMLKDHPYPM